MLEEEQELQDDSWNETSNDWSCSLREDTFTIFDHREQAIESCFGDKVNQIKN